MGVRAVIDWEWATVGDPLFDLARVHVAWLTRSSNRLYGGADQRRTFLEGYGSAFRATDPPGFWHMYLLFFILAPLAAVLRGAPRTLSPRQVARAVDPLRTVTTSATMAATATTAATAKAALIAPDRSGRRGAAG